MTKRQQGRAFELRIEKYLEKLGYRVETAHPVLQFIGPGKVRSKSHDFFGLLDIWAIHPGKQEQLLIQATISPDGASAKRKELEGWPWRPGRDQLQVWCRDPGSPQLIRVWCRLGMSAAGEVHWEEALVRPSKPSWPQSVLGPPPDPENRS